MKQPEEVGRDMVLQWLAKAEQDFGLAEHLLSEGLYPDAVGYHSQQAAEKYIKAYLVRQQVEVPKTHNLALLLDITAKVAGNLAKSLQGALALNAYGVDVRYPGDLPELTLKEAKGAVEIATLVRNEIMAALSNQQT